MADPFTTGTMAAIGIGSSLLGGVTSAAGAASKGESESAMYGYRAGVARMNADINRQNADYALTAGGANRVRSGMQTGFTISRQKTVQSASGFDVNDGSAAAVRDSTRKVGMIDQDAITTQASREALGHRNRAAGADAEAEGNLMAGKAAKTAAGYAVAGSILGTAASVSSKWLQASQVFGFGGGGGSLDASGNPYG